MSDGKVNILLVDDKPDKVLALQAILEDLGQNRVHAHSGRDALRRLLQEEFAVILLDVNMPGMDGFETASLIRQRPSTRDVPIIFVTAFSDDMHVVRGYSLGAVDYIQAPVVPDVLRTKVSVFVDLHRKSEQVRRQAAWLQRRAEQLHCLTSASLAINAALSVEKMVQVVTETAREALGCHQAITTAVPDQNWSRACMAASFSDLYGDRRALKLTPDPGGMGGLVCRTGKPMRMGRIELEGHPVWRGNGAGRLSPSRNWMAAPLTGRDGRALGLIEVFDRHDGDFTGEDEAILVQLAQMASIAIENTMYAQEREANRLKDEFLWTLSHELRTPLNAIVGWTQLLRMERLPEDAAHGLEVIERNAQAQTRLIEDLLDVSRITTGKFRLSTRRVAVATVVQAAIDTVRPSAEVKRIQLDSSIDCAAEVIGDPDRLQQVAWNLLSNAVKFTPPGGRVQVHLAASADRVELRVVDSGKGIPVAFLPYVFDRFRQADSSTTRANGGLGIGLTIARHIMDLHGGWIAAESAGEGHGATFVVALPLAAPATVPSAMPAAPPEPADALASMTDVAGLSVLLVDDDRDTREMIAEILKRLGLEVTAVASVREALTALVQSPPSLLVSDIAMPEQDGHELIRIIRELPPGRGGNVPAIALTAYARDEDRRRALAAGFQMHLPKPVDPARLAAAIAQLAAAPRPSQPQLQ